MKIMNSVWRHLIRLVVGAALIAGAYLAFEILFWSFWAILPYALAAAFVVMAYAIGLMAIDFARFRRQRQIDRRQAAELGKFMDENFKGIRVQS